jgi:hypothetical protein
VVNSGGIEPADAYKAAVELLKREYDRWIQNTLYLSGFLAGIFTLQKEIPSFLSLKTACLLASSVAAVTAVVALTTRASTDAWMKTLKSLENPDQHYSCSFRLYRCHYLSRVKFAELLKDIASVFIFWPGKFWENFFSVTRWYTRIAIAASVVFFVMFIQSEAKPNPSVPSRTAVSKDRAVPAGGAKPAMVPAAPPSPPSEATDQNSPAGVYDVTTSHLVSGALLPILTAILGGVAGGYVGYRGALRVQRNEMKNSARQQGGLCSRRCLRTSSAHSMPNPPARFINFSTQLGALSSR